MPQDNYELMSISGIGQIKVEQFGQDLLDTLAQFR
jgi:superfamily II DNA helicase RecQ